MWNILLVANTGSRWRRKTRRKLLGLHHPAFFFSVSDGIIKSEDMVPEPKKVISPHVLLSLMGTCSPFRYTSRCRIIIQVHSVVRRTSIAGFDRNSLANDLFPIRVDAQDEISDSGFSILRTSAAPRVLFMLEPDKFNDHVSHSVGIRARESAAELPTQIFGYRQNGDTRLPY